MTHQLFITLCILTLTAFAQQAKDLGRGRAGDILYVHHAPDPVNVRTGNFYLPMQDYLQPCFGYPIEIHRSYNSFFREDGVFGKGWIFNYHVSVVVDPDKGVTVLESDGFLTEYDPQDAPLTDKNKLISDIVELRKKEDIKYTGNPAGKGDTFYQELKTRLMSEDTYFKSQRERYLGGQSRISKTGKYASQQRGFSTLEETKDGFVRTLESGKREVFSRRGQLIRLEDLNNNTLSLLYDGNGQLIRIQDSCSQWVSLLYDKQGRVDTLKDNYNRTATYQYDKSGRLISMKGIDQEVIKFQYDKLDQLTHIDFGNQQVTTIEYDSKSGKVVRQSGPGKKVTNYAYGKARGADWATVKDNEGEDSKYEFFDGEHKVVFTDNKGQKTTTLLSPCCGKPLSILNASGKGDKFTYDQRNRIATRTDTAGAVTIFEYDDRFNLPSLIEKSKSDFTRFRYDSKGNMTFANTGAKQYIKATYTPQGKIATMTNESDIMLSFTYNNLGLPIIIRHMAGTSALAKELRISYQTTGEFINKEEYPRHSDAEQVIGTALRQMLTILEPTGLDFGI